MANTAYMKYILKESYNEVEFSSDRVCLETRFLFLNSFEVIVNNLSTAFAEYTL